MRRVAELQQLVHDAESYVSDSDATDVETTDAESVRSDANQYGRLKHSDSLLLLTQVSVVLLVWWGGHSV